MSKNTLSSLKYEIKTEFDAAQSAENDLKSLDKTIYNAMDDRVGYTARESLAGILKRFSLNSDDGLKAADRAANTLDTGYRKTDSLNAEADKILARAKTLVKELGEI